MIGMTGLARENGTADMTDTIGRAGIKRIKNSKALRWVLDKAPCCFFIGGEGGHSTRPLNMPESAGGTAALRKNGMF